MKNEKILSALWSLRAGLSVVSMQRDTIDNCDTIIDECQNRPDTVDEKTKIELSHKKRLYQLNKNDASHRFSFKGDVFLPLIKTIAWLTLLIVSTILFIAPALASAGLSVYTLLSEYHDYSVLMFICGLIGFGAFGTGGVALIIFLCSRLWENVTYNVCNIKSPRKVKKDREVAINMLPHYEKQIQELEDIIKKQEEDIASAEPTIRKKRKEIQLLANTSEQLYQALIQHYNTLLDLRDWQHLDLILFYFETGRSDSLKEALQLVDRQVQTNSIINATYDACSEICNTINVSSSRLGSLMAEGIVALSSQISDLKLSQSSQIEALLDSQNMLVALQNKANKTSLQLMDDCRYLKTLVEQEEIRHRNNI